MDLLKEITEEYLNIESINLMEAVSRSIRELKVAKRGKNITDKMVKDFMKSNSNLTMSASINALSAYSQYKTNRRNIVSLFATDAYSKRMTTKMVDAMVASKKFKIHRVRHVGNRKYWELKKLKSGF